MKKRIFCLGIVLALALSIFPAAALAATTENTGNYPTDAAESSYKDDIVTIYGYGGLTGLIDKNGKFNPSGACSTKDFATILANLFGSKHINPSNYGSGAITQGVACDLMTSVSRQLGYGVSFNNVTTNAAVDRGTACALLMIMFNSNTSLKKMVVGSNSNVVVVPLPGCESQGYVRGYTDVLANSWYANAVAWAVDNGIASGVGESFSPDQTVTVAQMYDFLWRSNKSPSASTTSCPFGGIKKTDPYYTALCWASNKGLVSNDRIDPYSTPATRSDLLWCLWKLSGSSYVGGTLSFTDVPTNASYATAVRWGVKNGIVSGTSSTTFDPLGSLSRAMTMVMLYHCYQSTNYSGYNGVPSGNSNVNYYYYQGERFQTNTWYQYGVGWLYNGEWYITHK